MYTPTHFAVRDRELIFALIERWSFATLVTSQDDLPLASHLPFLLRRDQGAHGTLISHMARANSQWQQLRPDREALTIFQAEHGYISPSWYGQQPSVPTWNYLVVHAYGRPRLIDDAAAMDMLEQVVGRHEAAYAEPWQMDRAYATRLLRGIVAFEIEITRLEGKFKLSQNRAGHDQQQVIAALAGSSDPLDRGLAEQMRAWYDRAEQVEEPV